MSSKEKANKANMFYFAVVAMLPLIIILLYKNNFHMIILSIFDKNNKWFNVLAENWIWFIIAFITLWSILVFVSTLFSIKKTTAIAGKQITIESIENKNIESLIYLSTYILPLLNFNDMFIVAILLFVIILIYCNSRYFITVNPILTMFYSVNKVTYNYGNGIKKTSIIISKEEFKEGDAFCIYELENGLCFAEKQNDAS